VLIDRFLENAIEVDVDVVFDGNEMLLGGIMEHVEQAGVHSGDSACVVPAPTLSSHVRARIEDYAERLARGLEVRGLLNIQYATRGEELYVLEANPRASRTVPFISKTTGVPLAKVATRVMMGETIAALRAAGVIPTDRAASYTTVKEAVMPWKRFPAEDTVLGPEMRATGEVMGIGPDFGTAYAKALLGAGHEVPQEGTLFFSLADRDKERGLDVARSYADLGFRILATHGTAGFLARHGIAATHVDKVGEGPYDPIRLIESGEINLIVNTPRGRRARGDGGLIRRAATRHGVPCVTTVKGGRAVANSIATHRDAVRTVRSLQDYHAGRHG
jgi:carbamoyl-phosphate synthase large subunit